MAEYRVVWEIDIDALSPRAAAVRAMEYQQDPRAQVHVYDVQLGREAGEKITRFDLDENTSQVISPKRARPKRRSRRS